MGRSHRRTIQEQKEAMEEDNVEFIIYELTVSPFVSHVISL